MISRQGELFVVTELKPHQLRFAAMVGLERQISNVIEGRQSDARDPWMTHIQGACAELAFSIMTGYSWHADVDTFKSKPDVGGVEVRSTTISNGGLVVYPKDNDHRPFALVIVTRLSFRLAGWEYGHVVRSKGKQQNDGTFRLDQTMLQPVETIPFGGSTGKKGLT